MHKFLFYNKFIIFLYMFRALLCTCVPEGYLQSVTIPDAVYYNFDLLIMSTVVLETYREIE